MRYSCLALAALVTTTAATQQSPGSFLFGRVVDSDGAPVVGATVKVLRSRLDTLPTMFEQNVNDHTFVAVETETKRSGMFRVAVPLAGQYGVCAEVGTEQTSIIHFPVHPSETVEIELLPSRVLRGRIVTGHGDERRGVRDVRVDVILHHEGTYPDLPGDVHVRPMRSRCSARSGADGKFDIVVPTTRQAWVEAWTATQSLGRMITPPQTELELVLPEPRFAHGLVRDAKTRAPIAGAIVKWAYDNTERRVAISGADGRFRLPTSDGGMLHVIPPKHQRTYLEGVAPSNPRDEPILVDVEPGRSLRARFVRPDGSSLRDARVFLISSLTVGTTIYGGAWWSQRLDSNGRLELGCLQDHAVSGFVEVDDAFVRFARVRPTDQPIDLGDVAVSATAVVAGEVRDHGGTPIPGATVLIMPRAADDAPREIAMWPHDKRYARTDTSGRFAFDRLRPGRYWIAAAADQGAPAIASLTAADESADLALRLERGGVLAGILRDDRGNPVPGATVSFYDHRPSPAAERFQLRSYRATTDAAGKFECRGLPLAGVFTVQAGGKVRGESVFTSFHGEFEPGVVDLELVLQ